jgi:hypothetical protein
LECHDTFGLNEGLGRVDILDLPKVYQPGQRIKIRVSVNQNRPMAKRWGFQITALDQREQFAGQFMLTDTTATQLLVRGARNYVQQTTAGAVSANADRREWTLEWVAPASDIGPVTFYLAGNAADGDGSTMSDMIYTSAEQIGAPSDPVVTLTTPNGGETLQAGKTFKISWESTNAQRHNLLFQAQGVGDIPRPIVMGLAAETREFEWTVPQTSTMRGRVIVVAEGPQGRADSDSSDRDFVVMDTPVIPGPQVATIAVTAKKITLTGSGLEAGTRLMVNGVGFVMPPQLKQTTKFIQKGTATNGRTINELLPVGQPAKLRLVNPNGGVTELNYTRP